MIKELIGAKVDSCIVYAGIYQSYMIYESDKPQPPEFCYTVYKNGRELRMRTDKEERDFPKRVAKLGTELCQLLRDQQEGIKAHVQHDLL